MRVLLLHTGLLSLLLAPAPAGDALPPGVVAEGRGVRITEREFHTYLTTLYRNDPLGRSLLEQLVRETAIRHEARRRGVKVSARALERKMAALEQRIQAAGGPASLEEYIRSLEVNRDEFFEALRLSIAHERMARQDFGLPEDEPVPVEKLNIWLADLTGKMEVQREGLKAGTAVVIDGETVSDAAFGRRLEHLLGTKDAAAVLTEMIGMRLIRAKARALGITVTEADVEKEIRYRTDRLHAKKELAGVSFESYVRAAEGKSLEAYKRSEKFRCEVLLKKICSSLHHEAYLQKFFEENRAFFERRYGRAVRLSTIFLKAVTFEDPLNKQVKTRKFHEALEELKALKARLQSGEVTFEEMARVYSEHPSGKAGGDVGFLAPATPGWKEIVAAALEAKEGAVLGPFKTPEGCHLVKVTGKRGPVTYDALRDRVAAEARQRYYRELLREAGVKRRF